MTSRSAIAGIAIIVLVVIGIVAVVGLHGSKASTTVAQTQSTNQSRQGTGTVAANSNTTSNEVSQKSTASNAVGQTSATSNTPSNTVSTAPAPSNSVELYLNESEFVSLVGTGGVYKVTVYNALNKSMSLSMVPNATMAWAASYTNSTPYTQNTVYEKVGALEQIYQTTTPKLAVMSFDSELGNTIDINESIDGMSYGYKVLGGSSSNTLPGSELIGYNSKYIVMYVSGTTSNQLMLANDIATKIS